MPLFRKKPVTIQAIQWDGSNTGDVLAFVGDGAAYHLPDITDQPSLRSPHISIETLEGTMTASVNDWIICGIKGECYPCKPDIFDSTYEPV